MDFLSRNTILCVAGVSTSMCLLYIQYLDWKEKRSRERRGEMLELGRHRQSNTYENDSSLLKAYAVRFGPGDEVYSKLGEFVRRRKLKAAFIMTCVGSIQAAKIRLAHATAQNKNFILEVNEPHEIVSLVGTLETKEDGTSGCHLHVSLADKDGKVIGGHLLNMICFTTAEIVLGECENLQFSRPFDPKTGFGELDVKNRVSPSLSSNFFIRDQEEKLEPSPASPRTKRRDKKIDSRIQQLQRERDHAVNHALEAASRAGRSLSRDNFDEKIAKQSSRTGVSDSSKELFLQMGSCYSTCLPGDLPRLQHENVRNKYELIEEVGSGMTAVVYSCISKHSGEEASLKLIRKSTLSERQLACVRREISLLKRLNHPGVLQYKEHYEDKTYIYLITELLKGGELFDSICDRETYTEKDAADVIISLIQIVQYLHSQGVVHCDIKPENILLDRRGPGAKIRLIDFGLAQEAFTEFSGIQLAAGTPGYISPEALVSEPNYGKPCDIWAIGVVAFCLTGGYPPFHEDDTDPVKRVEKALQKTRNCDWNFNDEVWTYVRSEVKDFISSILISDPKKRPLCSELLRSKWLAGVTDVSLKVTKRRLTRMLHLNRFRASVRAVLGAIRMKSMGKKSAEKKKKEVNDEILSPEDVTAMLPPVLHFTVTNEHVSETKLNEDEIEFTLEIASPGKPVLKRRISLTRKSAHSPSSRS
eukprot:g3190.t1